MSQDPHDPSVFNEPHMRPVYPVPPGIIPYASPNTPTPDPDQDIRYEPLFTKPAAPDIDNTVWDEPALAREIVGRAPVGDVTYAAWLQQGRARWTTAQSWFATIGLALVAGPFAIFGAMLNAGGSLSGFIMVTIIGPLTEEMMKIAAPAVVIESRPYVFRSGLQILFCGFYGGLAFAAIENVMYLLVYIKNPTPSIILWRWTVCVAMHTCCSTIAALGIRRVWRTTMDTGTRPRLSLAFPMLIVAAIVHGLYNAAAFAMEAADIF